MKSKEILLKHLALNDCEGYVSSDGRLYKAIIDALDEASTMYNVSKRYYWLKPDDTISNMWNEEDHKKYLTEQDIKDAERDGWQLIQINVC